MKAPMAHPSGVEAEDPRVRAFWRYHRNGAHKVPGEGVRPDHFYACSWCRPQGGFDYEEIPGTRKYNRDGSFSRRERRVWRDGEWEQFLLPQSAADGNFMGALAGRIG